MAEGDGVQAGNEREGAVVREVGASVRVSYILQCYLVSSEPRTEQCNV